MKLDQVVAIRNEVINAGGPGSGRHKGTGMTDSEFGAFAKKVGLARNATRLQEDALHSTGRHEDANNLYAKSKENVRQLLKAHNVVPQAFDSHMKQFAHSFGARAPRVKMANMFPNEEAD